MKNWDTEYREHIEKLELQIKELKDLLSVVTNVEPKHLSQETIQRIKQALKK